MSNKLHKNAPFKNKKSVTLDSEVKENSVENGSIKETHVSNSNSNVDINKFNLNNMNRNQRRMQTKITSRRGS